MLLSDAIGGGPDADAPEFDSEYKTEINNLKELSIFAGYYFLFGPYVMTYDLFFAPYHYGSYQGFAASASGSFNYTRSSILFEHAMIYYWIDTNQRYIQSLDFFDVNNRRIWVDPHVNGYAITQYFNVPLGEGFLIFGDYSVDSAEDADVILHEYAHAMQDNQTYGKYTYIDTEAGAMGEGFADYWAASCTYEISIEHGFNPACVGEWDEEYGFPFSYCIRTVNGTKHYDEDYVGQMHADGEIWSAALWELFMHPLVGKTVTDTIVLQSHSYVPVNPTFVDGVEALLDADINKYGGIHKDIICSITTNRGFDCNECITGTWTDNFGFIWNLTQTGTSISGTVNTSRCGSYNVTGSYNDPQIILTATKPSPPPDCCMSFTYNGTISTCSGGSGTWINPCALQGNWSMSKDGVGPLIQLETEGPFPCSGSN